MHISFEMGIHSMLKGGPSAAPLPQLSPTPLAVQSGGATEEELLPKLQYIVRENELGSLYTASALNEVVKRLQRIDWERMAKAWKVTRAMATDLAALALYDGEWTALVQSRPLRASYSVPFCSCFPRR